MSRPRSDPPHTGPTTSHQRRSQPLHPRSQPPESPTASARQPPTSPAPTSPAPPRRRVLIRLVGGFGLAVLGVLLYALCIDVFGGYPRYHSEALSWIGVVGLAVGAGVIWVVDERRHED